MFYASQTKLILDTGSILFGCKNCQKGQTMLGAPNGTTHPLMSLSAFGKAASSACGVQDVFLSAEAHFSAAKRLRKILQRSVDCRFAQGACKFFSQDPISAVYYKIKYVLRCGQCIEIDVCDNPGSVTCRKRWLPSVKTIFHAVQHVGSEVADCRLDLNNIGGGDVERSVVSLVNFHGALFTLSNFISMNNIQLPNCSSSCDLASGTSKICDICNAIDLAKIISSLTTSVLGCIHIFSIQGQTFCKPESLLPLIDECMVNYNSTVQISDRGQEILALSYTMAALTGCGNAGSGNQYSDFLTKCSYLRTVNGVGVTSMPSVSFPPEWYNTKTFKPNAETTASALKLFNKFRCDQSCPPWEEQCGISYACVPKYLKCQEIVPASPEEMYTIIGHIDMTKVRDSIFHVSRFSNETAVLASFDKNQFGDWMVYLASGQSINLTELSGGLVVSPTASLAFAPNNENAYGVRLFNYIRESAITEGTFNFTEGATVNLSMINAGPRTAVLLVRPIGRTENLTVKTPHPRATILEDTRFNPNDLGLQLTDFFDLKIAVENHEIPSPMFPFIDSAELDVYYQYKMTYENYLPFANVTAMSANGTWRAMAKGDEFFNNVYTLMPGHNVPLFGSYIFFTPDPNYHGVAWLHLNVCYCNLKHQEDKSVPFNLTIVVESVNDQPIAKAKALLLPPIAFNTTEEPNDGFAISSLRDSVVDVDNPAVGIVILSVSNSGLGKWYYNLDNSTWQQFSQTKQLRHGAKEGSVQILRLNPEDKLKLDLNDRAASWSHFHAMKEAWVHFMYWDMTDAKSNGLEIISKEDLLRSSTYSTEVFGFLLRRGCNGIPGSLAKIDACNICGGSGRSCLGCDGVANSGAIFDSCGKCTGGNTGKAHNYMRDCAGTCGKAELDDCNVCQRKSRNSTRSKFKDCMGICFGKARLNRCGRCYGGTSNLNATAGMDVCGVCNGDGSSCQGCDGVSNSGKVVDLCGACLHPREALFNGNCTKIANFMPRNSPTAGGRTIEVFGAGFNAFGVANCRFESLSRSFPAEVALLDETTKVRFTIVTPAAVAGSYSLQCKFDNSVDIFEAPSRLKFYFYSASRIALHSLSPVKVLKNTETNVTVNGTGFSQTDQLQCAILIGDRPLLINATVSSDTEAVCLLPMFSKSFNIRLTVVATKEEGTLTKLRSLPSRAWKAIQVYAAAPRPTIAKMSKNLKKIFIKFGSKIDVMRRGCEHIFSSETVPKLGKRAACYRKRLDELVVRLGLEATIAPGDSLVLKDNAITGHKEEISDTTSSSVTLQTEASLDPLSVELGGPSQVGMCDPVRIKASASGNAGGRKLGFSWNVSFALEVDLNLLTSNDTDDLAAIKMYLGSLPPHTHSILLSQDYVQPSSSERYLGYEFSVTATNFLGQKSNISTLIVQRTNTNAPTVKILGGSRRKVKSSKSFVIHGSVRHSSCESSKSALQYRWEVSYSDVQLDKKSRNTPRLYVPRSSLKGGNTYLFTLTASIIDDPLIFSSASVEVEVLNSNLIIKIKGGRYRVVGAGASLTLDASRSYDPDRDRSTPEAFSWECYDHDSNPCMVPHVNDTNRMVRLVLDASNKIVVESGILRANETYTFSFTYTKGTRSASKDVRIRVMPGSPPVVGIRPQKKSKVNSDEKVVVRGYIRSSSSNGVDAWWECVDQDGLNYINLAEPGVARTATRRSFRRRGTSWSVLIIKKDVLVEGASYNFRLNAQNDDGSGFAETVISVNGPPTLGSFTSNVLQGVALQTLFNLQAVEGWVDDAEDLPLKFKFGYIKPNGDDAFLGSISEESEVTVVLPAGEMNRNFTLTLFVDVSDSHGAKTRAFHAVSVTPLTDISTEAVSTFSDNIVDAFKANDLSSVIGQVTSTVNVLNEATKPGADIGATIPADVRRDIIGFKENATNGILDILKSVLDTETQNMIVTLMSDVTKDGKLFSGALRENIAKSIASLIKGQILPEHLIPQVPTPSTDFERVMVEEEEVEQDFAKSPEEVLKVVETYENIINVTATDNVTMSLKNEYTGVITSLLKGMCSGSAYGENATVANSEFSTLQAYKYDFSDGGTQNLPVDCDDCDNKAVVNLGDDLSTKYNSWDCTPDVVCNGVCVGSVQIPGDMFSDEANKKDTPIVSETVQMNVFNPETNALISETQLSSPMTFNVPVDKTKYNSSHSTECRYWDDFSSTWKNDSCTAEKNLKTIGNTTFVVCNCTRTGTVAAFQGPAYASLNSSSGNPGDDGTNSGNMTRNNPLITLFAILGIFGFSSLFGAGLFGYEKRKTSVRLTPRNS